ncbi:DNA/RNA non-specific endonuclease [Parasediminibacterium sp. JCM 36343]|uniref:DNA/RNA non-specific endonuclease n=1 Tax=Parasediminibacterium sp. JCM 36343 TaxID=3374279 RepID=UPI00397AFA19
MKFTKQLFVMAIAAITFLSSCTKDLTSDPANSVATGSVKNHNTNDVFGTTITEGFETGSKTSYAIASVTLGTGSWTMDDALIGSSTSDAKNGTQSARIRNTGSVYMNFDVTGVSTVKISHATYGTDGSSTWQLWQSTNAGSTYTQVGTTTITSSSTTLSQATFTVNVSSSVRFSIRKISGGTNRINIDDITISPTTTNYPPDDDNALMGNPSGATADTTKPNNYLMNKGYYLLCYNKSRAIPNWVSWHIQSSDLGSTARQDDFRSDSSLPTSWYHVGASSYSGSGFDRGHNCPSADRTSTVPANQATFLMTNMMPQAPNNNEVTWGNLEDYTRSLVTASGDEVYVICGSYGTGGTGSSGSANTVNSGNVTVPSNTWKVIVVLTNGSSDLSRVTTTTRVIAVNMPNVNTISSDWKIYRTSVDAIEAATGLDLLSNVSTSIQSVIEAQVDNQ